MKKLLLMAALVASVMSASANVALDMVNSFYYGDPPSGTGAQMDINVHITGQTYNDTVFGYGYGYVDVYWDSGTCSSPNYSYTKLTTFYVNSSGYGYTAITSHLDRHFLYQFIWLDSLGHVNVLNFHGCGATWNQDSFSLTPP